MRFSLKALLLVTLLAAICTAGFAWLRNAVEWRPPTVIVSTKIPDTAVTVELRGPDMKHHYWCDVITDDGNKTQRFLGPISDESLEPVVLEETDDGQLRIQWGTSPYAGFCILDLDAGLIVRDSNMANPSNESFVASDPHSSLSTRKDGEP